MKIDYWKIAHQWGYVLRAIMLAFILLLLVLPLFASTTPSTLTNINLQRLRCERIAKNALILEYRPSDEHPQAISELQNLLPNWQSEQASLFAIRDDQVQLLALQSNADYTAITVAVNALLKQNNPVDPAQVDIIVQHERGYALAVGQIATLLQNDLIARTQGWLIIEIVLLVLLVGGTVADQSIVAPRMRRRPSMITAQEALKPDDEDTSPRKVVK